MKKIILVLVLLAIFSSAAIALKEGETEFITYDDHCFAVTVANVWSSSVVDMSLSRCVKDYAKSLNVGESQKYFSNWECFVVTLDEVELDGEIDVIVTRCAEEDDENDGADDNVGGDDIIIDDGTDDNTEIPTPPDYTEPIIIIPPIEEIPAPVDDNFLDKQVSIGYILLLMGILVVLIFITMVLWLYYKKM